MKTKNSYLCITIRCEYKNNNNKRSSILLTYTTKQNKKKRNQFLIIFINIIINTYLFIQAIFLYTKIKPDVHLFWTIHVSNGIAYSCVIIMKKQKKKTVAEIHCNQKTINYIIALQYYNFNMGFYIDKMQWLVSCFILNENKNWIHPIKCCFSPPLKFLLKYKIFWGRTRKWIERLLATKFLI